MTSKGDASIDIESQDDSMPLQQVAGSLTTVNASSDHGNLPNNEEEVTEFSSCDADISGHTQLHKACKDGIYEEVVKLLQSEGVNINATDKDGRTPLHYACQGTALHITCSKGHTEIVQLLLKHKDAEVTKCDNKGLNPLEVAVEEGREDVAMAIVNSDKWKDALRNFKVTDDTSNKWYSKCETCKTPMRRIIKKMPDVAEVVFDKCHDTEKSPYDDDYKITYNYEFLEDFDLNEDDNEYCKYDNWPPKSELYSSQNHCLYILANSPSAKLLTHPLAITLLDHKWNKYGQIFYYANVIFYFLFVILQTSFALSVHSPSAGKCFEVFGNDTDTVIEGSGNDTDTFIDCFPEERFVPQKFVSFASPCLIACSVIMILREVFQLVWFRLQYFTNVISYVEVSLFSFTIIFAFVRSNECYCTRPWQWQIGVIAVFLSWIVLIFSIRKLPVVGIYVVMFIRIFHNFMKVVILALLLISAFAFPLYMTFFDAQDRSQGIRTPFITPWRSIFKTITMTMGEYDMDSILQQNNERNAYHVHYPVIAFSLLIVFLILMPILFLNLLIGLAVGDTEDIRKSADIQRQILKVKFTLPIEGYIRSVPGGIGKELKKRFILKEKKIIQPNDSKSLWKQVYAYVAQAEKYKTEPPATVADVRNQNRPLAEEVKDLRSSVCQEVKDLRSSMDQLLSIVKSMNERQEGGGGGRGTGVDVVRQGTT